MNETFDLIQRLATERTNLYRLAGKQHLSTEQISRIQEIEGRLVTLWDLHRREVAAIRRPVPYSQALRAA